MNEKTSPDRIHDWIPRTGHALRHAGIHFDAVRIGDVTAEHVAYELMQFTEFRAGPIVRELMRGRHMYFLVPARTAEAYRWPAGVRALSRGTTGLAYVGVPALDGFTWPLDWRSPPTREAPFVAVELLYEVVAQAPGAVSAFPDPRPAGASCSTPQDNLR